MENANKKRQWNNIEQLVKRLRSLLWTQRLIGAVAGAVLAVAILGGIWTVLALVAALTTLPVWFKVSLLILSISVLAIVTWRYSLAPLSRGDVDAVATRLEKRFSQLKGRLIAAVQFQRDPSALPAGTSPELVDLTARQTLEITETIELNKSLDYNSVSRFWKPSLALAALVTLITVFAPEYYSHALSVYTQPLVEVTPPLGYTLSASPLASDAIRFRDLTLTGHVLGADFPKQGAVHFRYEGGTWQEEEFDLRKLPKNQQTVETVLPLAPDCVKCVARWSSMSAQEAVKRSQFKLM